ncbi:osmoprotectant transport system substrate-binding protein [Asanoa hainanensis]|uniref:Osmoprotectant transport system substrate-binding protein n=1 Tax=Asanoa hainanensis TaxID=560556 RepID=A0A239PGC5_9ACTN|nr:glycine betaine ABC transporter substrate-binding protein [Asanoa hainanensis]SNT66111.1 osmoprotectant transport system substrate-binding protein [Asanoa hainanensis]
MRAVTRLATGAAGVLFVAGLLVGCGDAGSSGAQAPAATGGGAGCAPVAGQQLIALQDDKNLQNSDNVVAAINTKAATPQAVAATNKVAQALDTPKLIQLNRAVNVDRKTPAVAAQEFATANNLTAGIPTGASGDIIVGAANFSENQTLGELYKIVLTAAGYNVTVQTIGNRELYEPALEKGDIQVVPEYAASALDFLNTKVNGANAQPLSSPDINQTMSQLRPLGEKVGITFGEPSSAQDQNAFAVTKEFSDKYGVTTLSQLADKCSGSATILGGPPECPQRPKCQQGLVATYNFNAGSFSSLDAGGPQTKNALRTGVISVGLVLSSDADLAS